MSGNCLEELVACKQGVRVDKLAFQFHMVEMIGTSGQLQKSMVFFDIIELLRSSIRRQS